jgi:hypothetical protein
VAGLAPAVDRLVLPPAVEYLVRSGSGPALADPFLGAVMQENDLVNGGPDRVDVVEGLVPAPWRPTLVEIARSGLPPGSGRTRAIAP